MYKINIYIYLNLYLYFTVQSLIDRIAIYDSKYIIISSKRMDQ